MPTRRAATGCYKNLLPIQNFNDDDRLMVRTLPTSTALRNLGARLTKTTRKNKRLELRVKAGASN
jgi:hypothetical protein